MTADSDLDKLEQSVLDLEKRRITQDEGRKAQAAMESLQVTKTDTPAKSEDVDFIVRPSISAWG